MCWLPVGDCSRTAVAAAAAGALLCSVRLLRHQPSRVSERSNRHSAVHVCGEIRLAENNDKCKSHFSRECNCHLLF